MWIKSHFIGLTTPKGLLMKFLNSSLIESTNGDKKIKI